MPVTVQGPDNKTYQFPDGTTKEAAIGYFKKKGIGVNTPAALERKAMDPNAAYKPQTTGGVTPTPTAAGRFMEKTAPAVMNAASPALATLGGIAGGAVAGPPGAMAGAAAGGAAGKAIQTKADPRAGGAAQVYDAAMGQGLLEGFGGFASNAINKLTASASSKVLKAVNNYIGLTKTSLPKWSRTLETAEDVARTVLREAGVKKTLPEQQAAIEIARHAHDVATEKLVQAPGGRIMDLHAIAINRAVKLLKELEEEGAPQEQINAIDKNLDGITQNLKDKMNPAELLKAKRDISSQITNWGDTTNVRQRFLQTLYSDINDAIAKALPSQSSRQFLEHNAAQNRLIMARESVKDTLLSKATEKSAGLATKAARVGAKAAVGAAAGAAGGSEFGHAKEGALIGGLAGAGFGAVGERAAKMELPRADVRVQKAIEKAAPMLSKAARAVPAVARVLQTIQGATDNK